jgi:serine/threonine protein kinase
MYCTVDKLAYGGYSTVWLAHDAFSERYVAVKVGIAGAFSNETKVLQALAQQHASSCEHPGRDAISLPLDEFEISGTNGAHQCYTMPPAQCSLRDVSFCHLFSHEVTRALAYHLTLAIAYTHSQGYVHGGLSPHVESASQLSIANLDLA